jgi:membrane-associated protein
VLGSVLGDSGGYWLGRYGGRLILKRVDGSTIWRRAQALFARHGALAILLTRFVIIPLAPPINLIAGSSHYAFRRFLRFAITGELIGVALYGGLGYLFADQWEALSDLAGGLHGVLIGLLALAVGGVLAYIYRHRRAVPANVGS